MPTKHPGNNIYGAVLLLALAGCKVQEIPGDPGAEQAPIASHAATTSAAIGSVVHPPLYLLAGNRSNDPKDRYTVNTVCAPFFSYGPSQTQGADFSLRKGNVVTMLQRDFGYSRIRTANGREGFVATDQLTPAVPLPAEDTAAFAPSALPPDVLPPSASMPAAQLSQPLQVPSLDQMVSPVEPPLPSGGASPVASASPTATPKP